MPSTWQDDTEGDGYHGNDLIFGRTRDGGQSVPSDANGVGEAVEKSYPE
jgi:hypothetical protein